MDEIKGNEHIRGFYLVLVAIISLIGGYLIKDPIHDNFINRYSQIGGVWKPHGDLLLNCSITTINDTFFIRMEGSYSTSEDWVLLGKGIMKEKAGSFEGTLTTINASYKTTPIWGHAELAGTDQLGVTVFFDKEHLTQPRIYAFIREIQNIHTVSEN